MPSRITKRICELGIDHLPSIDERFIWTVFGPSGIYADVSATITVRVFMITTNVPYIPAIFIGNGIRGIDPTCCLIKEDTHLPSIEIKMTGMNFGKINPYTGEKPSESVCISHDAAEFGPIQAENIILWTYGYYVKRYLFGLHEACPPIRFRHWIRVYLLDMLGFGSRSEWKLVAGLFNPAFHLGSEIIIFEERPFSP